MKEKGSNPHIYARTMKYNTLAWKMYRSPLIKYIGDEWFPHIDDSLDISGGVRLPAFVKPA